MNTPSVPTLLHIDDDLLLVHKPPGLPSHATVDPGRDHLVAATERLLRSQGIASELHLCHRLDRDTSGVVVFARSRAAAAALGDAFAEREMDKRYLAICRVESSLASRWDVDDHLRARKDGVVIAVRSGGDRASSRFRQLDREPPYALVECRPMTGRRHQLRVHLADSGAPIVGDPVYGEPEHDQGVAPRLMLHAYRITLQHPTTGQPLQVEAPMPADMRRVAERVGLVVE
ncbi:MAG: RNA pseudouridine synthase [Deltaproteobacteria bacterium]|nr:RNA pseudouridine synthase [Deltaproteobacteria bacterium]